MAAEFREEAQRTRRVLERVPEGKLTWRPHPKSMSLGQLALHIASIPERLVPMLRQSEHELNREASQSPDEAKTTGEILAALERSVQDAGAYLDRASDDELRAAWTLKAGGRPLFTKSRMEVIRMFMLSHVYHHRGQLSVYLRLLDVPVPSIYGPSADDNPFA